MATEPRHTAPHGMEPYDQKGPDDLGALSPEQQEKLNKFKIQTRLGNEKYLRDHPEVQCLITGFLRETLLQRPDNVRDFAARHFTNPNLSSMVESQLEKRQDEIRQNKVLQKL